MEYVKWAFLTLTLSIVLGTSLSIPRASAHVLESDNGVSAILHIKPDDRPVADKPTVVRFLFSSGKGGFRINDYDVKLRLFQDDQLKLTNDVQPAYFGANAEGDTTVTFPGAGVYKLQATGTPQKGTSPPFKLNFTVRVTGQSEAKTGDGTTVLLLSAFSIAMLTMLAINGIHSGKRYRQKP